MTPEEITITVAPKNGVKARPIVARFGEIEFRDNLDTNSATSRERCIKKMATKFKTEPEDLEFIDSKLTTLADAADIAADLEAAEFPKPRSIQVPAANTATAGKPSVILPGKGVTITQVGAQFGLLLGETGQFYIRGGVVTRAVKVDGEIKLEPMKPAAACSDFETVAKIVKMEMTGVGAVEAPTTCSETTARLIIESQAFRNGLPPIAVVSRCPAS